MTNTNETATKANAFASTFYFFADTHSNAKKIKRACNPTHPDRAEVQCKFGQAQLRTDRRAADNTGLAKVAVQCSADTFVVNQSLVLRINICGENRHLRQARKRYKQAYDDPYNHRADTKTTRLLTSKQTFGRPILC